MNYSAFIAAAPCVLHRHANRRAMQVATPRTTPYASAVPRRTALKLTVALAAALLVPGSPAKAAAKGSDPALGERFDNRDFGYSFIPPGAGWSKEVATLSAGRAATIFLREADGDTNVNMVTTPVSSDFQKLSSFGTMEKVLLTLVPTKQKDLEGTLISSVLDTSKNAYIVEYTVTSRGVKRHLLTVFSLQPGRFLLTLTGQAQEENWPAVESLMRSVVDSYKIKLMD